MRRKVFFSFNYDPDKWRVSQIRNIGVIEGNNSVSDNEWEKIKSGKEPAIQKWINNQLEGRCCTVVLIGQYTAGRKWINYEIQKSWNDGKGVLGIYIHRLKNQGKKQARKGRNPFNYFELNKYFLFDFNLSSIVKTYEPPHYDSKKTYKYISDNIAKWIDEAIAIRNGEGLRKIQKATSKSGL